MTYINEKKLKELNEEKRKLKLETTAGSALTLSIGTLAFINAPDLGFTLLTSVAAITTGFAANQLNNTNNKIKKLDKNK